MAGGPSGSCAAEVLAKAGHIQTWLFLKAQARQVPALLVAAIPLCMVDRVRSSESIN